mgnify:CR=1 FL=1
MRMISDRLFVSIATIACFFLLPKNPIPAQCPTLNNNATLTSPGCSPGPVCNVCPGDLVTLNATGTGLQPGVCVNWYYGTTNNFNPYNGQGTLLGCSQVEVTPPNPCAGGCPRILALWVNACGNEPDNEYIVMWSGGGFYVDDFTLDFNNANNAGAGNGDVGVDCMWQEPSAGAIASIQSICPNATVVGAGPGEAVPANVPVLIFTSAGLSFNYNFGGFCPLSPTIYVMQNGCTRTDDAFPQTGSPVTTSVSVACGCTDALTYNPPQLVGGDGAFVAWTPIFPVYGNAGCGFPPLPGAPGGGGNNPIVIPPYTFEVTQDMCNGGPYWVTGIVEPLPAGCPQTFTNYMPFNVTCRTPDLGTASVCETSGLFNLNTIRDPLIPNGTWDGPGVSGNFFDPSGLSGTVTLTFTPAGACDLPATTTIEVTPPPTVVFFPTQAVCAGGEATLELFFTGDAPWTFELLENGVSVGNYTTSNNPFTITRTIFGPTFFSTNGLADAVCSGYDDQTFVDISPAPESVLSASGPQTLCPGQAAQMTINTSGGNGPFEYTLLIDGVQQPPITTNNNPYTFSQVINVNTTFTLYAAVANNCIGDPQGEAVFTAAGPSGALASGSANQCMPVPIDLNLSFSGGGPYTFVYAVNGVAQAPITVNGPNHTLTVTPGPGANVYMLVSVSNPSCSGSASGSFTVNAGVGDPLTATISGDGDACPGSNHLLAVKFTGDAPWTFTLLANGIATDTFMTSDNPFVFFVQPTDTTVYTLTNVSGNGCAGVGVGQATVNTIPPPHATIYGGGDICQTGGTADIFIAFSGPGTQFTFVMTANNDTLPPITTTQNPHVLTLQPTMGTLYQLVSVNNGQCKGTVDSFAWILVFAPSTGVMSGSATFCDSAMTQVPIAFTGTGPFEIIYSIDGVPQPQISTFDDIFYIPVNVNVTTQYQLLSIKSPGCVGNPVGAATITVNYSPEFTVPQISCNPAQGNYTVSFEASGGGGSPYTLVSGSGAFTGNLFVSDPIPEADPYLFVFQGANGCGPVTVSGASICNCTTSAGSMDLTPLPELCVYDTVFAVFAGGEFLDANDTLRFILHTSPGATPSQILAWNTTPVFTFQPGMDAGVTYYISAIAGNANGAGQIALDDPCLSVSPGVPVRFRALPDAAFATSDTSLCTGGNLEVSGLLTGEAPFEIVFSVNGINQSPVVFMGSVFQATFSVLNDQTVVIASLSDAQCSAANADTLHLFALANPQIVNLEANCLPTFDAYVLTFEIASGESPYSVNGVSGTITGATFASDPIASGNAYSVQVTDAFGCISPGFSGSLTCACPTDAGSMADTLVTACVGESITAVHLGDEILQAGDILQFVLHTEAGPSLGAVLNIADQPTFPFIAGLTFPGQTYYISAVAGPDDGSGSVNLQNACLSVAAGTPVRWFATPTASLSGDFDVCANQSQPLVINFTGQAPFNFSYTQNGALNTGTAMSNSFIINATLLQTAVFELVSVQDANCPGTAVGQATVTVHPTPTISNLTTTCSVDNLSYVVEFDVTVGDIGSISVGLLPGVYDLTTGHFTSDPLPVSQPYGFSVADQWQCGALTQGGTVVCACITSAGVMSAIPLLVCHGQNAVGQPATGVNLDGDDVLLYVLSATPTPSQPTDILGVQLAPNFAFVPGVTIPGTTYYILAAAGNAGPAGIDLSDPCLSLSNSTPVVWREAVTATLSGDQTLCAGSEATLNVLFEGNGPYTFTLFGGDTPQNFTTSASPFSFQITPSAGGTYIIGDLTGADGCAGQSQGTAFVTVSLPPTATLSGSQDVCEGGSATFAIQLGGAPPYQLVYAVNGIPQPQVTTLQNTYLISANNIQQGQTYTLISVFDQFCQGTVSGQYTIDLIPTPTLALSAPAQICAGQSASVVVTLNNAASVSFSLNESGGMSQPFSNVSNGQSVVVSPVASGVFSVENVVIAGNACAPELPGPFAIVVGSVQLSATVSQYGAFNVSCPDASDGAITLTPDGLFPPFSVAWSPVGLSGLQTQGLPAGAYAATVSDQTGCTAVFEAVLSAPNPIQIDAESIAPLCFGQSNGALHVRNITGGSGPYVLRIDNQQPVVVDSFPISYGSLNAGQFEFHIEDVLGCTAVQMFLVQDPPQMRVMLGQDITLRLGDSVLLIPEIMAGPITSFAWSPTRWLSSPNELNTYAAPPVTTRYTIQVENANGCTAEDDVLIQVTNKRDVFIPNAIRPNSRIDNERLAVYSGPEVVAIPYMRVFDRWGSLIFEAENLLPNSPEQGWDGAYKGKMMDPGVYVYVIAVRYADGEIAIKSGDVTLLR